MTYRIFYMLVLSGLVLTPPSGLWIACAERFVSDRSTGRTGTAQAQLQDPPLKKMTIVFPGGEKVEASKADTTDLRERGLMGNPRLKLNEGMLFLFETDELHMMWMKNMRIAIDMIWLNNQKEIIEIARAVPPCQDDPCPVYGPALPSRYVLELHEGAAGSFHLKKGMRLQF